MKSTCMKLSLAALLLVSAAATTGAAYADDGWGTLSGSVAVTSDYRFRGISQNARDFAPSAGITWTGSDGFYAGVWSSKTDWYNVSSWPAEPSYEVDFFAGKHFDLGDGYDLNVEAYYYSYPDYQQSYTGWTAGFASFYETLVQLSHTIGPVNVTLTGASSPEWSFDGGVSYYLGGTASYPLTDWLSLSGTVGHQWVQYLADDRGRLNVGYTHFDIGMTATYKAWAFDVRFNGTDMGQVECSHYMATEDACTGGVIATLTYNISSLL
jgi:uncharacterized protein (TIGR02001 family)